MKKYLAVLIALLFATGAFAQEAEKKAAEFKYSFFGIAYGVMGAQDKEEYDYSHVRVRPMFTIGNENVKGVVRFEIDQDYGETSDSTGADKGTDNQVVEVKWAYMQVKDMLVQNLNFTMGLNAYYFPMVVDNDFAMTQAAYDFGMGKAIFTYMKIDEFNVTENTDADVNQRDDAQVYAFDLPVKAGAINVRPGFMYISSSQDSSTGFDLDLDDVADITVSKAKLYNAALNVNGDFGVVGVDLTGAYLWGTVNQSGEEIDVAAYAYDALVTIKPVEGISLGLFATYTSGQDDGDEVAAYDLVMDTFMGACDGRLFLVEAGGVAADGGHTQHDFTDTAAGLAIYGLSVEAAFGKATILAQYGYASIADDTYMGDSFIGHEIDFGASYEVAPATSLFCQFGYIVAGDIYEDDAYEFAYGLKTSI